MTSSASRRRLDFHHIKVDLKKNQKSFNPYYVLIGQIAGQCEQSIGIIIVVTYNMQQGHIRIYLCVYFNSRFALNVIR